MLSGSDASSENTVCAHKFSLAFSCKLAGFIEDYEHTVFD